MATKNEVFLKKSRFYGSRKPRTERESLSKMELIRKYNLVDATDDHFYIRNIIYDDCPIWRKSLKKKIYCVEKYYTPSLFDDWYKAPYVILSSSVEKESVMSIAKHTQFNNTHITKISGKNVLTRNTKYILSNIEKKGNNMKDVMTLLSNTFRIEKTAEKVYYQIAEILKSEGKKRIKKHFGCELYFGESSRYASVPKTWEVILDFLKKHDPNFDSHFHEIREKNKGYQNEILCNFSDKFVFLKNPRTEQKDTFIILQTGVRANESYLHTTKDELFVMDEVINHSDIYIYIGGKCSYLFYNEIINALDECMKIDSREKLQYYVTTGDENDDLYMTLHRVEKRSMDSLIFSNGEKEKIVNHIDKFLTQSNVYKERNIIYKTGIMLYGKPGTGKSSISNALAAKYDRNIIAITVPNIGNINLDKLTEALSVDSEEYIVLFEDIDTLFLNRDGMGITTNDEKSKIINKLLQFLDSNNSPTNVIFIATTNHLERLDDALLRDGRFDLKVEIKEIFAKDAIRLGKEFGLTEENAKKCVTLYDSMRAHDDSSCLYNQSKLQNIILNKLSEQNNVNIKVLTD